MQIKTIVRYYNAPIKITKKDYLQYQVLSRKWSNWNFNTLLVEM